MALYELVDRGPFSAPALVIAFDGWVNAGSAGTLAAELLSEGGSVVSKFDADRLYDYRVVRPTLDFVEGVMARLDWPELAIRRRRLGERDLLVLTGTEPNWSWQLLCSEVADLAVELGVVESVSIGGIPWATPHTRPVTVMTTGSDRRRLADGADLPGGLLRVPAAAVSAIEYAVGKKGIPTTGFWARVPNYVGSSYPAAALTLLDRVAAHLGVQVDTADLRREADEQRVQLDAIAEGRADVRAMIERLEQVVDSQQTVSGEDLAAEIERFLREQGR